MNGAACVCASDFHRRCGVAGHGWITPAMRHAAKSGRDVNEAKRLEQERVGTCSEHGPYELHIGSIDPGELARRCPQCAIWQEQ